MVVMIKEVLIMMMEVTMEVTTATRHATLALAGTQDRWTAGNV